MIFVFDEQDSKSKLLATRAQVARKIEAMKAMLYETTNLALLEEVDEELTKLNGRLLSSMEISEEGLLLSQVNS